MKRMLWYPYLFLFVAVIVAIVLRKNGIDVDNVVIASIAFGGVLLTLHHAQKARIKEDTIKVILETETSEFFQKQYRAVEYGFLKSSEITDIVEGYKNYSKSEDKEEKEIAQAVRGILNFYEFLAYGVQNDLFNKEIVKNNFRSLLCGQIYDLRDLIAIERRGSIKAYENIVDLYIEWVDRGPDSKEWDEYSRGKTDTPLRNEP